MPSGPAGRPVGGQWLWVALIVLVVVLALMLLAGLWLRKSDSAAPTKKMFSGGGVHGTPGLSSEVLAANTGSFLSAAREGLHHPSDAIPLEAVGGSARPESAKKKLKPKKPWRAYETWDDLMKDKGALDAYWDERGEILNNLPDDWAKVRKQAAPLIKDAFEWAGHIDMVKGQLQIVSKYPSKNEPIQPEWSSVRASVSPEVARMVWSKPALFVYHTHPQDEDQLTWAHPPSPPDLSSGVFSSFKGHYAAELVLSRNAIYMYGLRAARRTALWNMPHPSLEVTRVAFDTYCAFSAMRSYAEFYTLAEMETLAAKFGLFYITYPDDNHAQSRFNLFFQLAPHVDVSEIRIRAEELDEAQKVLYAPPAGKQGRRRIRKAPRHSARADP